MTRVLENENATFCIMLPTSGARSDAHPLPGAEGNDERIARKGTGAPQADVSDQQLHHQGPQEQGGKGRCGLLSGDAQDVQIGAFAENSFRLLDLLI